MGHLFALGAWKGDQLVGVVVVGRPVARVLQTGDRAEVTRLATDGTPNACSFLYQKAKRVAQAMGYRSLITYTRVDESGASLRAVGACCVAEVEARSWAKHSVSRPRGEAAAVVARRRWELMVR
jgi:hypothetical protein